MTGPGKEFRKGITLIELFEMFPDNRAAEEWFEGALWSAAGNPICCPHCGCSGKLRTVPSRRPVPYWCGSCGRNFSVRFRTGMHRSHIPLRVWAIAINSWATSLKGVSSMELHRGLGNTQKSAYFMAQRLREAWSLLLFGMAGSAEPNESLSVGQRKNLPRSKRGETTGRDPVGKTAITIVKDRKTNSVFACVMQATG